MRKRPFPNLITQHMLQIIALLLGQAFGPDVTLSQFERDVVVEAVQQGLELIDAIPKRR